MAFVMDFLNNFGINLSHDGSTTHPEGVTQPEASRPEADSPIHNIIIIGSGPAGYTAATYAARAELKPLVFEGLESGGNLMKTTEVENYPGFHEGIMGPQLMNNMRAQAERFGADLRMDSADSVDLTGDIKKVVAGGVEYKARTVILATGAEPRHLNVEGEDLLNGRGVSYCATCDGFFFKGKDIAVIGGGDSAMEEADFLSTFGASVTIVHRRDEFRASAIMVERAKKNDKIRFITNATVNRVLGENAVEKLELKDTQTGELSTLEVQAMFVAVGHDPRTDLVKGQVALDSAGYVKVEAPSTRTNLPGVFAAGDIADPTYQQAVTAAGTGCRAALDAQHYLAERSDSFTSEIGSAHHLPVDDTPGTAQEANTDGQ